MGRLLQSVRFLVDLHKKKQEFLPLQKTFTVRNNRETIEKSVKYGFVQYFCTVLDMHGKRLVIRQYVPFPMLRVVQAS